MGGCCATAACPEPAVRLDQTTGWKFAPESIQHSQNTPGATAFMTISVSMIHTASATKVARDHATGDHPNTPSQEKCGIEVGCPYE